MKTSKLILLIAPIFFTFFASGCAKSLLHWDDTEPEEYVEEDFGAEPYRAEPFQPENGEDMVTSLPIEERVRGRLLPYRSSYLLKDINFEFDRYDLDGMSKAFLEHNIAFLKAHPNLKIEIQGHCDERGTNNYNISLGERRAQSVKSYLIALGVDENRIRTISYGEERPFCFESNEICWFQNRRAHFLVAVWDKEVRDTF